jgi:lipoprotein-releasing system permease protein
MFKLPYEWQVGWRHVRGAGASSNRFIAFISRVSMLGITLGVAALIVLLSVVNGFQVEVRDRMLGMVPHISVVQRGGGGTAFADLASVTSTVQANPAVRASAPAVVAQTLLGRGDALRGVVLRGIDPRFEAAVSPVVQSLPPALLQRLQPGSQQAILGQELARLLGAKVGDSVVVVQPGTANAVVQPGSTSQNNSPRMTPLVVAGTFAAGHFEFDSTVVLVHLQDAARLLGVPGPNTLHVQIAQPMQAPQLAQQLAVQLQPTQGYGVLVRDWTQVNRNWFESVQLQRRMLVLILTLIVAVAAFNLVSTLVMTVTDKRGEIAILRTLGASPASVMAIFVVQGALAGLVGTAGGVALGLGLAYNLDVLVPALERALGTTLLSPSIYLIDHMPSQPLMSDVVPVALVSLLLSLLATLYPSWRASQLRPAQALRGE